MRLSRVLRDALRSYLFVIPISILVREGEEERRGDKDGKGDGFIK